MDVQEVNKKLLDELEEMGFPLARAMRALHSSGNSNLEDAINWIVDHEDDPEIDQMPSVSLQIEVEDFQTGSMSDEVKLKAQKLRDKTCKRNKEDDKEMEHGREKERIRARKELQEAKQVAEENKRKRSLSRMPHCKFLLGCRICVFNHFIIYSVIALRKAEKQEENRAREKVRQKLNQDKVERRGKLGLHPRVLDHASLKTTTPMAQENKEVLPVVSTRIRVDSTTKVDLMRECLRSLKRNNKDDDIKVRKAFETLLIYVRNVARDPNEEKFRKIRMNNPVFKERVGTFELGIKFLEICGFGKVEGGKYLFLPRDRFDMAVFRSAGNELQSAITNPFYGLLSIEA